MDEVCCGCNLRSRVCIMGLVDIVSSTLGITWFAYMYLFVVYDYRIKHYLLEEEDGDCSERLKNIETKDLSHLYMITLVLFGVSMMGYLILGSLLVTFSLQEPTKYFAVMNLVAQFPFIVLQIAGCSMFFSDELCSLNTISSRFNVSQRLSVQWANLILTILFIVGYKLYELWVLASIIVQLNKKNSIYITSVAQLHELPSAIESIEANDNENDFLFPLRAEEDGYYKNQKDHDHAKGRRHTDTHYKRNKVHSLPFINGQPRKYNAYDNRNDNNPLRNLENQHQHKNQELQTIVPHRPKTYPYRDKDNYDAYEQDQDFDTRNARYSNVPEETQKKIYRESIQRVNRETTYF